MWNGAWKVLLPLPPPDGRHFPLKVRSKPECERTSVWRPKRNWGESPQEFSGWVTSTQLFNIGLGYGVLLYCFPKDPGMSRTFLEQFAWWDSRFFLLQSHKILIATFVVLQYQDQQPLTLFPWAPKAGAGRRASSRLSKETNEPFHTSHLSCWPSPSLPRLTSQPHSLSFCYFPAS